VARTVLVADDSPTVQKKASGILTGEGLEVVTVSNGVAAVKKLPTVKPLVVLADVSMPGKDGYEVCEFIKSSAELRHVSVLLIFSDTDPYEGQRGARVGADGTIKKPFDRDELIASVTKFFAQAEAAAPKPAAPPPQAAPDALEVEPVDEEAESAAKQGAPDFASVYQGVAFGVPAAEESSAAFSEPELPPAEPILSSEPEAAFEPAMPEPEIPAPELTALPPEEPPVQEPEPVSADPVMIEEPVAPPAESEPPAEGTLMFRTPADIAEPVLSDEAESAAPAAEPPTAVEPEPPVEAPEEPAESSQTLESYTLTEAASGSVRFDSPQPEAAPAPEPEPEPDPVAPPPPSAPAVDPDQIFAIVHKVVVKMSPPALSPSMIEDMARKFTDEIVQDLQSES
jgi:CheY-like chemotaxis protein